MHKLYSNSRYPLPHPLPIPTLTPSPTRVFYFLMTHGAWVESHRYVNAAEMPNYVKMLNVIMIRDMPTTNSSCKRGRKKKTNRIIRNESTHLLSIGYECDNPAASSSSVTSRVRHFFWFKRLLCVIQLDLQGACGHSSICQYILAFSLSSLPRCLAAC